MNAINKDKKRALLLYRTRRALAGNEALRWEALGRAILSVAASARLLREVADFAQVTNAPTAIDAGRFVEQAIVNAIAEATGVDLLSAITRNDKPVVFEGDPVYVLPAGWSSTPLDPRPSFYLTDDEARVAFEAIAARRLWAKCTCDTSVGFACKLCKRAAERIKRDPYFDEVQRINDVAYRWASIMLKRRRVWGAP